MEWLDGKTAPKTGEQFLADIRYPWPLVAAWNAADENFVYANLQAEADKNDNIVDVWFDTERENADQVRRWTPLPQLPATEAS